MALIKVIEVLAESPNSWEEAAQTAVKQASESVARHCLSLRQGIRGQGRE
jgi:flavin-binding protein dodecin